MIITSSFQIMNCKFHFTSMSEFQFASIRIFSSLICNSNHFHTFSTTSKYRFNLSRIILDVFYQCSSPLKWIKTIRTYEFSFPWKFFMDCGNRSLLTETIFCKSGKHDNANNSVWSVGKNCSQLVQNHFLLSVTSFLILFHEVVVCYNRCSLCFSFLCSIFKFYSCTISMIFFLLPLIPFTGCPVYLN